MSPAETPDRAERSGHDEEWPLSRGRRGLAIAVGCLTVLVILGALLWFAVTHTETTGDRQPFGLRGGPPAIAGGEVPGWRGT